MTAEVVILNKQGAALAADSAVTYSGIKGNKIYNSANKIFNLSKYYPIGILVYQSADFLGVPWETIIKIYRDNTLKDKELNEVRDYALDFIEFLKNFKFEDQDKDNFVNSTVYFYLILKIFKKIDEKIIEIEKSGNFNKEISREEIIKILNEYKNELENTELDNKINDKTLEKIRNFLDKIIKEKINYIVDYYFKNTINDFIVNKNVIREILLDKELIPIFFDIALNLLIKFPTNYIDDNYSGLVFTGFGKKEIFPSICSFKLYGKVEDYLKYKKMDQYLIGKNGNACIFPYAQRDVVDMFCKGIDPEYWEEIMSNFNNLFIKYPDIIFDFIFSNDEEKQNARKIMSSKFDEIIQKLTKQLSVFKDFEKIKYIDPLLDVVERLPKNELVEMAESLVYMTVFRKGIVETQQTVGGPIDVATISKGDGFIWIKRKHYFKPELNPRFFNNYFRGGKIGERRK